MDGGAAAIVSALSYDREGYAAIGCGLLIKLGAAMTCRCFVLSENTLKLNRQAHRSGPPDLKVRFQCLHKIRTECASCDK
jgi:hypothetical protein